jgi:hypothetical protein
MLLDGPSQLHEQHQVFRGEQGAFDWRGALKSGPPVKHRAVGGEPKIPEFLGMNGVGSAQKLGERRAQRPAKEAGEPHDDAAKAEQPCRAKGSGALDEREMAIEISASAASNWSS